MTKHRNTLRRSEISKDGRERWQLYSRSSGKHIVRYVRDSRELIYAVFAEKAAAEEFFRIMAQISDLYHIDQPIEEG